MPPQDLTEVSEKNYKQQQATKQRHERDSYH